MAARVWRALTAPSRFLLPRRTNYQQAPTGNATELRTWTASRSNDDLVTKNSKGFEAKESDSSSMRSYRQRLSGWRSGVLQFAICASVVFLINLVVTIWGSVSHKTNEGILEQGECKRVKNLNSGLHVLINVLSAVLLSGSNYCMQCMTAPTRDEVDRAHATQRWLDIGVPSFRNLRRIGRGRLILWLLLGLSSLPLHLLYNSAVYVSLSTNSYGMFVVSQAFVDDPNCQNCTDTSSNEPKVIASAAMLKSLWTQSRNGKLDRLSPAECLSAYGTLVQSTRRNLLIVTADENIVSAPTQFSFPSDRDINNTNWYQYGYFDAVNALRHYQRNFDELYWMCSELPRKTTPCINRIRELRQAPQSWVVGASCSSTQPGYCDQYRWPVDYCLSERADLQCKLHFNLAIAIVVTTLNFFKAVLMFYVVYSTKNNPLATVGDAIASFLDEKDPTTTKMGPVGVHDLKKGHNLSGITWSDARWRWKDATSKRRRAVTLILFTIAIGIVLGLIIWAVREINFVAATSTSDVFNFGLGAVDARALISSASFPTNMATLALIANLPQLVLSILYFAYNGLFTAMLGAYEWVSYAHKKKGLRLSRKPSGAQRSTYFLQLPYRFGVPLVMLSAILHWLVSQSIFVVAFDVYNEHGEPQTAKIGWEYDAVNRTCGYSPIAMLAVVILGVVMLVAVVGFGYIPYKRGMPLAGSCSLAISAACHPDEQSFVGDSALSKKRLQWGVVSTGVDGIGHCAFTNGEVRPLMKGGTYA